MTPSLRTPARGAVSVWRSGLTLPAKDQHPYLDVHRLHQLVLAGFPPRTGAASDERLPPVLFAAARTEATREGGSGPTRAGRPQRILVQSTARPNWTPLIEAGQLADAPTQLTEQSFAAGDHVEVRVIANPSYRDRETGRRIGLTALADCGQWLHRHLTAHGLHVHPHQIAPGNPHRLTGRKGSRHITLIACDFWARGTVADPGLFHEVLTKGLGPGKAFGCGLLRARGPLT